MADPNDNRPPLPPPPHLPPETYSHLIHALLSLQDSASHTYPPPVPAPPLAGPSSYYPPGPSIPFPLRAEPQTAGASQLTPSPAATASTAQDPEGSEDAISTDDKRRRNTAASARFRVKKKLKTLNLERTVADLTGRTEELEREATDLRRENTWLKEIVLLKGSNLAASTSHASASAHRHDDGGGDASEPESGVNRGGKGKGKER